MYIINFKMNQFSDPNFFEVLPLLFNFDQLSSAFVMVNGENGEKLNCINKMTIMKKKFDIFPFYGEKNFIR